MDYHLNLNLIWNCFCFFIALLKEGKYLIHKNIVEYLYKSRKMFNMIFSIKELY